MDRLILSDAQWDRISGLIIGRPDQRGSTGRDNRMFVEGVLWIVRTGSPWRDLPETFGEWNSVFRRFSRWSAKGVWLRMFEALADDPDFEYLIVDSTIVRAHQHANGGKGGSKSGHRTFARRPDDKNPYGCPWFGLSGPLLPHGRPSRRRASGPAAHRGAPGRGRDGRCRLRFRCIAIHDRRKRRSSRHSEQPLTGNQVSAQQALLCRASSNRMLFLETEAVQARRYALRKDGTKLLRSRCYRRNSALAKVIVHTA